MILNNRTLAKREGRGEGQKRSLDEAKLPNFTFNAYVSNMILESTIYKTLYDFTASPTKLFPGTYIFKYGSN